MRSAIVLLRRKKRSARAIKRRTFRKENLFIPVRRGSSRIARGTPHSRVIVLMDHSATHFFSLTMLTAMPKLGSKDPTGSLPLQGDELGSFGHGSGAAPVTVVGIVFLNLPPSSSPAI